jgi:hypothetical protein
MCRHGAQSVPRRPGAAGSLSPAWRCSNGAYVLPFLFPFPERRSPEPRPCPVRLRRWRWGRRQRPEGALRRRRRGPSPPLTAAGEPDRRQAMAATTAEGGAFSAEVRWSGATLVTVAGELLDETRGVKGRLDRPLQAVLEVAEGAALTANVNLLTHLAAVRTRVLMAQGADFQAARTQAREELAYAFDLAPCFRRDPVLPSTSPPVTCRRCSSCWCTSAAPRACGTSTSTATTTSATHHCPARAARNQVLPRAVPGHESRPLLCVTPAVWRPGPE